MSMKMRANTDYPIHDFIAARWSPYGFADRGVDQNDLRSLFEAARWAPSCYNEQPWKYIVATQADVAGFEKVLSCLVEGNQDWAKDVPVLVLGLVNTKFAHNGKANHHARHDLGQASANLCLEATARGLVVHQMAGILPDRIREIFALPEDVEPVTALAIGYAGDPDSLDEKRKKSDSKRRPRKSVADFVFGSEFGKSASFLK